MPFAPFEAIVLQKVGESGTDGTTDNDKRKKHAAWLFTVLLEKKDYLQKKLKEKKIETNQVHFRNDKYTIFKKFVKNHKFPNMDFIENKYLVIPIHPKITEPTAKYICNQINNII